MGPVKQNIGCAKITPYMLAWSVRLPRKKGNKTSWPSRCGIPYGNLECEVNGWGRSSLSLSKRLGAEALLEGAA